MPNRSRRQLCLAALGVAASAGARAGFDVWNSELTLGRDALQAMIDRQFPRTGRYAGIVTVTLSDPRLGLDAAANRAALATRVGVASPLIAAGPQEGALAISSALRFDPAMRALRLERPRAERVEWRGLSGNEALPLRQIGGRVAEELLQGQVLHAFTADELSVAGKPWEIGEITVLADGIKVQLKPAQPAS